MYGSLFNHLMAGSSHPLPHVGQGATICYWSDRHAGTIISLSEDAKAVTWQRDKVKRIDTNGMSESQNYEYEPDTQGEIIVFTLRKNGRWIRKGQSMRNGTTLSIGHRSEYYDYSF